MTMEHTNGAITRVWTVVLAVVLVPAVMAMPWLPPWMMPFVTTAVAKGLVVLGLMVIWRAGLVSFGQALYYAIGGYAVGLLGVYAGVTDMIAAVALAGLAGALAAAFVGTLLARYREIFFAMLSLAFSMILYGVLVKSETLGSTDGIPLKPATLAGVTLDPASRLLAVYILTIVTALAAGLLMRAYLKSTTGALLEPIRDNEIRVEYLGASVRGTIHGMLVLAGMLAGLGGALTALAVGHIDPSMAYWTMSGSFVFATVLAGTGSVLAPFLGALLFEVIRVVALQFVPHYWQLILGSALLLIILYLPGGIWSLFERKRVEGGT
jgi:ABC-type branched-subunit amino acid transport system permease subunit